MATLSESKKRDFVSQMIVLITQNKQRVVDKGYDPENKIEELKTLLTTADEAEAQQTEAKAAAKDATKKAQKTLKMAYTAGSETVELLTGLLGKEDSLILEMRKLRK